MAWNSQRLGQFGWNAARYALGPIAGICIPWIVVHRASQSLWGEVVGVMIMVQLAAHVLQWGSKDLLLREFAKRPGSTADLLSASMSTRVWLFAPILLVLYLLPGDHAIAVPWLFLLYLTSAFDAPIVWHKRFRSALLIDLVGFLVQIAGLLHSTDLRSETVIHWMLIGQGCRAILLFVVFFRDIKGGSLLDIRTHLISALPFFLIGFSGLLASRIDLYTANVLMDRTEVARYQIVASLFIQFQALAALVVAPLTKDLYRLSVESVSRYTRRMRVWALAGLVPMCIAGWCVLTFLFHLDLHWSVYAAACMLVWPVYAYVPVITQLYKHHRERSVMWANFAAAALTCALTLILLPRLGITGGLTAAAAGQWLMLAWMKREERRLHALPNL